MADTQHTHKQPEIWKPVVGYEGIYEVSNMGRVKSLERRVPSGEGRTRLNKERILKPGINRGTHQYVNLSNKQNPDDKAISRYVHQLVMEAFVGPRPKGMHVCHWNDNGLDNRLSNLRYDTPSGNAYDRVRNGGHYQALKTHCDKGHEFTTENTFTNGSSGRRGCKTCKIEYDSTYTEELRLGKRIPRKIKDKCKRGHLLEEPNLMPSRLPKRNCLACSRSYTWASKNNMLSDLQAISDSYYFKIMKK